MTLETSVNAGRFSAGNPLLSGQVAFTRDRSGTQDNARRSPRSRTAARRRGAGSAGGRSTRCARTRGGRVPSAPTAPPRGERGAGAPGGLRRRHARPRRSSPNQTPGRASIRGNVCPPRWRPPRGSSVCGRMRGHVIVVGLGNTGYRLVEHLDAMGVPVAAAESAEDSGFVRQLYGE